MNRCDTMLVSILVTGVCLSTMGACGSGGTCMVGGMHGRGVHGGGHVWWGGMCGRGHAWQGDMHGKGVCMTGGMHDGGICNKGCVHFDAPCDRELSYCFGVVQGYKVKQCYYFLKWLHYCNQKSTIEVTIKLESTVVDPGFPRRECQPLSLGRKPII